MTDRCEPPPELSSKRDVFFIVAPSGDRLPVHWNPFIAQGWWGYPILLNPARAAERGWVYEGPVTPPAEVEALRAERDAFAQQAGECSGGYQTLEREVTTLLARVARMEELVRSAYAEGWVDHWSCKYDTAADAWEWASARAALSAETP